ncbi:MAG TPA: type II toxin-antitoxin system death-on-curing family toxin [Egibacteraceae bacterium]|nr:type II toxin-antitoxin system death-on-curing family toxin [Egibacteraceae bacterium]
MTEYLTVVEVMALHRLLLQRDGGTAGIRDPGALQAALYRPLTGYYTDLVEEAAALFESLIVNHAFLDGNKRVAFAAMDVFLRLNGMRLTAEPTAIHAFLMDLFDRNALRFEHVEPWLRRWTGPA